ncbi:MAG: FAD:protein FMN transferase [Acidimicrobiales bacterium]
MGRASAGVVDERDGERRRAAAAPAGSGRTYRGSAFGVGAEVVVTDPGALAGVVELLGDEVDAMDRAASRFRADSEVCMLRDAGGLPRPVSPTLLEAVLVAVRMAAATDGAVDPTVGAAMCRIGYDRDFGDLGRRVAGRLPAPEAVPGWRLIEIDEERSTIRVPAGTLIDLGATAKGLTADRVATRAAAGLRCGVMVSLGGDVAVAGPPPPGGFAIGVGDVAGGVADVEVAIAGGGLATSGVSVRRWVLGGHPVHHLVDPASGLPVEAVWRTVSVVAATCVGADAAATAAMVKGRDAPSWLAGRGLPARLVTPTGEVELVGPWPSPDVRPGAVVSSSDQ